MDYKLNYFSPSQDPFHLNDVQPLKDQVSTNIVLLSLRNQSSIIAFDIKKRNIIWFLEGYFNLQHDVDILDKEGTSISIFDNNITPNTNYQKESNGNIFTIVKNLPSLSKLNEEIIMLSYPEDLKSVNKINITKEKFSKLDKNLIPKTITEGNSELIFENNSITIEEANYGRLFEYDLKRKEVLWEYINRNDKKDLHYIMGWSRRLNVLPESVKSVLSFNNDI